MQSPARSPSPSPATTNTTSSVFRCGNSTSSPGASSKRRRLTAAAPAACARSSPRATSSQCAMPTAGATLCHRCAQSGRATLDGWLRPIPSFAACARLGLVDEPAQLLEEGAGGCALTLERLDPVEPGQYCAGFVHADDRSRAKRTALRRKRAFLDSGNGGVLEVRRGEPGARALLLVVRCRARRAARRRR